MRTIFITGGTGYIGKRLIKILLQRGHHIITLVRKGSESKLQPGVEIVIANAFDANTFKDTIPKDSVFVQLLGVSHPSPKKAKQFKEIDLRSVKASADAAAIAGVSHFIYVSVSMSPSTIMKDFQDVRKEGEEYCLSKDLNCTFLRPWYVLGPGHWWPIVLLPLYGIAELIPSVRNKVHEKALVTISQMITILMKVIEADPTPLRILEIKNIRQKKLE